MSLPKLSNTVMTPASEDVYRERDRQQAIRSAIHEWSPEAAEIFDEAVNRPFTQSECDRLNAEMAPHNETRRIEAKAEMDRKVAAHEPLSEEEIEDFFHTSGPPAGYVARGWSGFYDWKGSD